MNVVPDWQKMMNVAPLKFQIKPLFSPPPPFLCEKLGEACAWIISALYLNTIYSSIGFLFSRRSELSSRR